MEPATTPENATLGASPAAVTGSVPSVSDAEWQAVHDEIAYRFRDTRREVGYAQALFLAEGELIEKELKVRALKRAIEQALKCSYIDSLCDTCLQGLKDAVS